MSPPKEETNCKAILYVCLLVVMLLTETRSVQSLGQKKKKKNFYFFWRFNFKFAGFNFLNWKQKKKKKMKQIGLRDHSS